MPTLFRTIYSHQLAVSGHPLSESHCLINTNMVNAAMVLYECLYSIMISVRKEDGYTFAYVNLFLTYQYHSLLFKKTVVWELD